MAKYLILTYEISCLGGGQLYVQRRAEYLVKQGIDVRIVVFYHDSSYFPLEMKFEGIPYYIIPEMGMTTSMLTASKVDKIVDGLLNKIGESDDISIESHTLTTIEWGELIAFKCKGRHLAYPLAEPTISSYYFEPGKKIFTYKLNNNEFYGCTSVSLKQIFGKKNVPSNYINIGYNVSELEDECIPHIKYVKKEPDYVISTVGRLDKDYIEPLIQGCINLAEVFPQQSFVLLIGGGSKTPGRENYLKNKYEKTKCKNLQVIFTGYIEKLGKDIFQMSDVFAGMGTASLNSISQGCLTINIDPNDGMRYASGFFGTDTNNFAYSESGKIFEISDKLKEAYLLNADKRDSIIQTANELFVNSYEENACFKQLDEVISKIDRASEESILKVSRLYRLYVIMVYTIYTFLKRTKTWDIIKGIIKK